MSEWLEPLKSWQAMVVALGGVLSLMAAWWRLREGVAKLSEQRERRLRKLLNKDLQGHVQPLALQLDLRQAFGRVQDEREFAFAQTRHNPLGLLICRLQAEGYVRLNAAGKGYEDCRLVTRRIVPMAMLSFLSLIVGMLAFLPLVIAVVLAWRIDTVVGAMVAVGALYFEGMLMWCFVKAEAAKRLLSLKAHPPLSDEWKLAPVPAVMPASSERNEENRPARASKTARGKAKSNGNGATPPSDAG